MKNRRISTKHTELGKTSKQLTIQLTAAEMKKQGWTIFHCNWLS